MRSPAPESIAETQFLARALSKSGALYLPARQADLRSALGLIARRSQTVFRRNSLSQHSLNPTQVWVRSSIFLASIGPSPCDSGISRPAPLVQSRKVDTIVEAGASVATGRFTAPRLMPRLAC